MCVHDDVDEAVDHWASDARAAADKTGADVPDQKHGAVMIDMQEASLVELFAEHHEDGVGEVDALGKEVAVNTVEREIVGVVDGVTQKAVTFCDDDFEEADEKRRVDDDDDDVVENHNRLDVERFFEKFAKNERTEDDEANVGDADPENVGEVVHEGKADSSLVDFRIDEQGQLSNVKNI